MKAAALLLFLAFTAAQADQLDFWKHHSTGLAVVTFTYGSWQESHWLAAYQSDDTDLDHEDEFGANKTLFRISLAPRLYSAGNLSSDFQAAVTVQATRDGRWLLSATGPPGAVPLKWSIDMLSSDVAVRQLIKPQAGGKATKTLHVYIRKVRDAICLTFTDALD